MRVLKFKPTRNRPAKRLHSWNTTKANNLVRRVRSRLFYFLMA